MNRKERRIAQSQSRTKQAPAGTLGLITIPRDVLLRAVKLHQAGNLNEAEAIYRNLIATYPGDAMPLHLLGTILVKHSSGDALKVLEKSIAINPGYADAHCFRGIALFKMERYGEALASYDKAVALNPGYAIAYVNRGNALYKLKHYDAAMASFDKAAALGYDGADAHYGRGLTLCNLKQYGEALTCYDKAIAINPDDADVYYDRGVVLQNLGQFANALANYDRAIAINPDYAYAYWNKGLLKLLREEYEEGWKLYEWRWKAPGHADAATFKKPLWLGKEPLANKTIMIHAEQGLGDTLQFCRYVPMLEALGAKVIFGVPDSLVGLMSTLKGVHVLLGQGTHTQVFDYHCPLVSLPLAFGTTAATIPANVPYLYADAQRQALWRERLGEKSKPRIGLVWSGTLHPTLQYDRSIDFGPLAPLLELDYDFHSLQKEIRTEEKAVVAVSKVTSHADDLKDFADTAALMSEMDLVISIDTSVAHLAGALGKKTWLLIHSYPDWRWMLEREDSPWYPTARLFRQQRHGDWESVIGKVKAELALLS